MSETVPYFFLSYSHNDQKAWVHKFHTDLFEAVKTKTIENIGGKDAFDDRKSLNPGDIWPSKIVSAIGSTKVLVCLYSPSFFAKDKTRDYCAKEFAAFLMRAELVYDWYYDNGKRWLGLARAQNVLPVLWLGVDDLLELNDLPPRLVRSITFDLPVRSVANNPADTYSETYRTDGMLALTRRRNDTYRRIVDRLATRVVQLARQPLPPLDSLPDLDALYNPFWDPPPRSARIPADAGQPGDDTPPGDPAEQHAAGALSGPKQLLAVELRRGGAAAQDWTPYPAASSLAVLVADTANSSRLAVRHISLDVDTPDFPGIAGTLLDEATNNQARPILFVDPLICADAAARQAVLELVRQPWLGGIIIPVAASDPEATRLADEFRNELAGLEARSDRLVVRGSAATPEDFCTAIISTADEILARIVRFGKVGQSPPPNDGPTTRPSISSAT